MLKSCNYELWSISSTNKPLDFTRFVVSLSLTWGLNASRASAKVTLAPAGKKTLMNVRRGSPFILRWGFQKSAYTQVKLFWTGTTWELGEGATVSIDLVHGSWALSRVPVKAIFTEAKVADSVKKLAKDKGVVVDTKKATVTPGSDSKTAAVSQTIDQELTRQFKGNFIIPSGDGKKLEVVSFENLVKTAQAFYISTAYGYLDKIALNYKAKVPKDKSFIEMAGGSGAPANADPSTGPSAKETVKPAPKEVDKPPTYAQLVSTGNNNSLNNPLLELVLYVNAQEIGRYKCTSAKAFLRDSSKKNNVLPNGNYTIASSAIQGLAAEDGGLFLPITPAFKTNRTQLGIHLDPSFNKANGKDGTYGSIGLTTAADRDAVQKAILENKISLLVVTLDTAETNPTQKPDSVVKESYAVVDLNSAKVFAEQSRKGVIYNIGSLFKIFIGVCVINKNADLQIEFEGRIIKDLLIQMLDESRNDSANSLIKYVGGLGAINTLLVSSGFLKTKIDTLYGDPGQKQSTCQDIINCFKAIFLQPAYLPLRESLQGSSLELAGETHTKLGVNSNFEGGVSLIQNTAGDKTVVCILATSGKSVAAIVKRVAGVIP